METVKRSFASGKRLKRIEGVTGWLMITPALVLFLAFVLYPAISTFSLSFFDWDLLTEREFVGFENFGKLFADERLGLIIGNTLLLTVVSVILKVALGFLLAYFVFRLRNRFGSVFMESAIFFPIANLRADDALGARLLRAIEAGIGVVSMHLNLDCAAGGIDESLAEAVGAQGEIHVCERFESGGYGRIYTIKKQTFSQFAASLLQALNTHRAFLYGAEAEEIGKAASFCGAGVDAGAIAAAKRCGADAIVSADIKHNFICDALESGLKVVQLTHYASENYGFKKIYQHLKDVLGVPCAYHEDKCML